MKKFFVFSDIHGNYTDFYKALLDAGYDENNENHWLIGLGDYFDRYQEPLQVLKFLNRIKRKVLVKGNHESLLWDLIERGFPLAYDYSNGTAQTIVDLAPDITDFKEACTKCYALLFDFYNNLVDYVELQNYIGVHSFIPLKTVEKLPHQNNVNYRLTAMPNWRVEADKNDWENARWGNPYELSQMSEFLPEGKTLIFGHWHTSWPRHKWEHKDEFSPEADFTPYYGKGFIGIDGCVASQYGKFNILVIEDDFII